MSYGMLVGVYLLALLLGIFLTYMISKKSKKEEQKFIPSQTSRKISWALSTLLAVLGIIGFAGQLIFWANDKDASFKINQDKGYHQVETFNSMEFFAKDGIYVFYNQSGVLTYKTADNKLKATPANAKVLESNDILPGIYTAEYLQNVDAFALVFVTNYQLKEERTFVVVPVGTKIEQYINLTFK